VLHFYFDANLFLIVFEFLIDAFSGLAKKIIINSDASLDIS
jgi:hypothetical protein